MATERSGSATLQSNERVKHMAGAVTAWATRFSSPALADGRWPASMLMSFYACRRRVPYIAASHSLTLLKVENGDG